MRIALLTHSVRPRGGVVHTLELADALVAQGHAVTVIASAEPGERLFREVALPVEIIRLPTLQGDIVAQVAQRIASLVDALPGLLRGGGFDLVHAQDSLSGNALALLRRGGVATGPWLRTVHHLDVFAEPVLNAWQDRAWREADDVACVSDTWHAQVQALHDRPVQRMFNGVNLARYDARPRPDDGARTMALGVPAACGPVCLLVGGVEARKNTVRLLQAFVRLRHRDPAWADARLVVAGGASMLDHGSARRAWDREIAEAGAAADGVVLTGPLPDADLPPLMRRADALAMPSLVEGFGLAAIEALACGTPVLVSRRAPFTEHLQGESAVAWCEPEDVGSIADGLRHAIALPRPQGTPAVCRSHSWDHSAARHAAWYGGVLARRARDSFASPSLSGAHP